MSSLRLVVLALLVPIVVGFHEHAFDLLRSMRQHRDANNVVLVISDAHGTSFAASVREGVRPSPFLYTARGKLHAMQSNVDLRDWESKSIVRRLLHLVRHGTFPIEGGVLIGTAERPSGWWAISGMPTGADDEALVLRWANETGLTLGRHKGWLQALTP